MNDHEIVLAIQNRLDGTEWSADTLEEIADILARNGYPLRNFEVEEFDGMGNRLDGTGDLREDKPGDLSSSG